MVQQLDRSHSGYMSTSGCSIISTACCLTVCNIYLKTFMDFSPVMVFFSVNTLGGEKENELGFFLGMCPQDI